MRRLCLHFLSILYVGLLLSGCSNVEPTLDSSFFNEAPCAPPCWHNLNIGYSNENDVYQTLQNLPFVESSSIREWSKNWLGDWSAIEVHYQCSRTGRGQCGGITIYQDRVKEIWFAVDETVEIELVVQKLGSPSYIHYGILGSDSAYCSIHFVWESEGIFVTHSSSSSDLSSCKALQQGKGPSSHLPISSIHYISREAFPFDPGTCCLQTPWTGFKDD